MPTRRDVVRAIAASAAALALGPARPAAASGAGHRRAASSTAEGEAGLGLWTRHAAPERRSPCRRGVHAVTLIPDAAALRRRRPPAGPLRRRRRPRRFERSLTFEATPGRHFFGHGHFADGGAALPHHRKRRRGRARHWSACGMPAGFRVVGEWPSGGVGPHDLALSAPMAAALLVANGGIDMQPGLWPRQAQRGRHRLLDRRASISPPAGRSRRPCSARHCLAVDPASRGARGRRNRLRLRGHGSRRRRPAARRPRRSGWQAALRRCAGRRAGPAIAAGSARSRSMRRAGSLPRPRRSAGFAACGTRRPALPRRGPDRRLLRHRPARRTVSRCPPDRALVGAVGAARLEPLLSAPHGFDNHLAVA